MELQKSNFTVNSRKLDLGLIVAHDRELQAMQRLAIRTTKILNSKGVQNLYLNSLDEMIPRLKKFFQESLSGVLDVKVELGRGGGVGDGVFGRRTCGRRRR